MKQLFTLLIGLLIIPFIGHSQYTDVLNNNINFEFQTSTSGFTGPADGSPPSEPVIQTKIQLNSAGYGPAACASWIGATPTSTGSNVSITSVTDRAFTTTYNVFSEMWESDGAPYCDYNFTIDDHYAFGTGLLRDGQITQLVVYPDDDFRPVQWISSLGNNGNTNLHPNVSNWDQSLRLAWRYTHGDNINDPLNFGTINHGETKRDINANRNAPAGASNPTLAYTDQATASSADIYYSFTINEAASVTISTVSSLTSFDSYLRLYDSSNDYVDGNDDHTGSQAQLTVDLCPGTYKIQVEGFQGSEGLFELSVNVTNKPTLGASIDVDPVSCPGNADGLMTGVGTGGVEPYLFFWFEGFTYIGGGSQLINVPLGKEFRVEVTDICGTSVSSANYSTYNGDDTNPVARCQTEPFIFSLQDGEERTLTVDEVDNGSTDNCGIDNMLLSKKTFNTASGPLTEVRLTVFDENGNSDFCNVNVAVVNITSVDDLAEANEQVQIYPNPTSGDFTVDLPWKQLEQNTQIVVRDLLGKTLHRTTAQTGINHLSLPQLAPGLYTVSIEGLQTLASKRLVIQ